MIKKSTVSNLRIIKIVELVFLSLFIISLFIPYAGGIRPKEYFWDIWSNNINVWPFFVVIGLPLILSFFLFILISVKPPFGKLTLKLLTWIIAGIYAFNIIMFLIEAVENIIYPDHFLGGFYVIYSFTLVFSLFLFVLTIIKSKDNYLKIKNYIIAIITIPVVSYSIWITEFEFGGFLLNISFIVLYTIAILKVLKISNIEKTLKLKY